MSMEITGAVPESVIYIRLAKDANKIKKRGERLPDDMRNKVRIALLDCHLKLDHDTGFLRLKRKKK